MTALETSNLQLGRGRSRAVACALLLGLSGLGMTGCLGGDSSGSGTDPAGGGGTAVTGDGDGDGDGDGVAAGDGDGDGDGGGVLPGDGDAPVAPVTAALPSRSTTIALTSDDRYLVVVNRQNDSLSVIEVRTADGKDAYRTVAEVPVGKEPRYVAITPDDAYAYVSNTVDGTVSVIALSSAPAPYGTPIEVGTEPRGLAVTPNGKYVYVANHTAGDVSVIRTSDNTVVGKVWVGGNPQAIAITNDGDSDDRDEQVLVTHFFSKVTDPAVPDGFDDAKQGVVKYFSVAESLAAAPEAAAYYVRPLDDSGFTADRRAFCLNTRRALEETGDVVFFNSGADAVPDNADQGAGALQGDVFCPDVESTDASAEGPIGRDVQGVYPNQLYAALVRGKWLLLPNVGAAPEPPVRFNVNVQALVSAIDLENGYDISTNLNDQIKREPAPDSVESLAKLFGNDVVAIDADPKGEKLLIVSRGGNYVLRAWLGKDGTVDIGAPDRVQRYQTGNIPSGVVMSYDGLRAYTNNEVNTSVTAIDLEYDVVLERDIPSSAPPAAGTQKHRNLVGKLAFFTALGIQDTHDVDGYDGKFDIELRDIVPLQFRGKASDNAWSACTSCHEDGHSDNVTWIFPTGPRQTIALEGTFDKDDVSDQRILNWNAVRGSVTDFNNNSRGVQGGVGFATDVNGEDRTGEVFNHGPTQGISDALDAMTDWVALAVRAPIMPDEPAAETYGDGYTGLVDGREIFGKYCASCHGGAKWTKSSIAGYQNDPTFADNPLGAKFFDGVPPLDPTLRVAGPQINAIADGDTIVTQFLEKVGTFDGQGLLEIRGAGAIAGQSTQGFGALGDAGFNVPSLLGVGYHGPWLHDGSALTLGEVFDKHGLRVEGQSISIGQRLTAGQAEALQAFLESIDDGTETF